MRRMSTWWMLLAGLLAQPGFATEAASFAVGDAAPESVGMNPDGEPVRLADSRGKVVVLSFWASWCAPCRKELPILENLQRKAGDDIKVIGINYREDVMAMRKALARWKDAQMTFTRDPDGALAKRFGLKGLPTLVMIGRDGRIASIHSGYGEKMLDEFVDELNRLLGEPVTTNES